MERGKSTGQYQPKRHDSSKQMWRDFASIVEQNDTKHLPGSCDLDESVTEGRIVG